MRLALHTKANSYADNGLKVRIGKVNGRQARKIFNQTSMDFKNYTHYIFAHTVRHIMKEHGNPIAEAKRNQIAITLKDFALIPDILMHPDIVKAGKDANSLYYEKKIGNKYIVIEYIKSGKRKRLEIKTMYIKKAP